MHFMQLSVNCLDPTAVWRVGGSPAYEDLPESAETLLLANAPLRVRARKPVRQDLYFAATQVLNVVEDDRVERREYRVHTLGYIYALTFDELMTEPLLEWHYHPYAGRDDTHVHFMKGAGHPADKLHVPTGRVSFESLMRFIIMEFDVADPHEGWEGILADCEGRFKRFRTWS